MANVTITLLVDTTGLLNDQNPDPVMKNYCTLAQLGGQLVDDPNNDLRNDISEVFLGDSITWNAVSNSDTLPQGVTGVIVNIQAITATTVFGKGQAIATQLVPGATGGTSATGVISYGSEGDTVTYTITFDVVTSPSSSGSTSRSYFIDPKIRVHSH